RRVATRGSAQAGDQRARDALLPRSRVGRPPPRPVPRAVRARGARPAVAPAAAPGAARPSRIARLLSGVTATGGVAGGGRMPRRAAQARITIAFTVPLARLIAAAVLLVSTTVAVPAALI